MKPDHDDQKEPIILTLGCLEIEFEPWKGWLKEAFRVLVCLLIAAIIVYLLKELQ